MNKVLVIGQNKVETDKGQYIFKNILQSTAEKIQHMLADVDANRVMSEKFVMQQ